MEAPEDRQPLIIIPKAQHWILFWSTRLILESFPSAASKGKITREWFLAVCLEVIFSSGLPKVTTFSFVNYIYCHSISVLNFSNPIKVLLLLGFLKTKIQLVISINKGDH